MQVPYHAAHLCCSQCKTSFIDENDPEGSDLQGILVEKGQIYDSKCYNERFGKKCASCDVYIEGNLNMYLNIYLNTYFGRRYELKYKICFNIFHVSCFMLLIIA